MTGKSKPRRWRKVSMPELLQMWEFLAKRGICAYGMTNTELCQRYGAENIRHKPGVGWFKLTVKP